MPIIYKDSDDAASNIVNELIAEDFVDNAQEVAKIISQLPDPASADKPKLKKGEKDEPSP